MSTTLEQIQEEVGQIRLDDSLLFLNHLVAVAREDSKDPELKRYLNSRNTPFPVFVVHFIVKQILLHASNLGIYTMDWPRFKRLLDLYFKLDEPIVGDPNWKHADPTGFFERILAQQLPSQRRNMLQKYGLALGLFRDVGLIKWPFEYNMKFDLENELGVSIEEFIMMGFVCHSLRLVNYKGQQCPGTFTHNYLAEAYSQGIKVCVPEVWNKFLPRIACNRDMFRNVCGKEIYRVNDMRYIQYEFNPLHRYPIIDVGGERYLAVDPELIIERVTFGLFYDLFEHYGTDFSERFGYVFDKFVGKLLKTVCPPNSIWSMSEWAINQSDEKMKNTGKKGDWIYKGPSYNVLFECKSLRPNIELITYGSDAAISDMVNRISAALEQLIKHNDAIQQGKWQEWGLVPMPPIFVIVTYGRIQTVNGPFVRKQIHNLLFVKKSNLPPFVVLSLEELDIVIRLVELGHALDDVILALANEENSFDPLQRYRSELTSQALSSYTYKIGEKMMDEIHPGMSDK